MGAGQKHGKIPPPSKKRAKVRLSTGPSHKKKPGPQTTPLISSAIPSKQPAFLIVGIGASAGGLEAMEEFFRHMPPSSGMAFVVVSHQHADHVSLLPSLLGRCTAMPVVQVTDGIKVEPNRVYLAPGGIQMAMLLGSLHFMEPHSKERVPLPIDYFFHALAKDQTQRAVGVILSGTGTDGTVGMRAIKSESGLTIAQDPQTAKYQGMPQSAIAAGLVDVVQPVDKMSESLLAYAKSLTKPMQSLSDHEMNQTLQKICILLRERTGNNFALYKEQTIQRRIERRMHVHQIESLSQYFQFLLANQSEPDALFHELLIGVTSFFRDTQAFEALAKKGLPSLVEDKPEGATLRVWVAGCSTGEEAYSLAILIREYLTQKKLRLAVQIFASDLDSRAIEQARAGLYPVGIAGDMTPERLQRFFTKEDSRYRIKKVIRDLVVFAAHNVLTDAPFTKLDLLSCRNLLIYLGAKAQERLLPLFHYALKPNGLLLLGSSETIGGFDDGFVSIDRKSKLFRRTGTAHVPPHFERFPAGLAAGATETRLEAEASLFTARPASIPDLVQQFLVSQYAPASVIVNQRGEVVYIHGHTGPYLEPAPGPPTHDLIEMTREELRHEVATALHQAARKEQKVLHRGVPIQVDGQATLVNVTVEKIAEPEALAGLFLVTFEQSKTEKPNARKSAAVQTTAPLMHKKTRLIRELAFTKERLQRTIEELQSTNEEMTSTNEELQSTNEELQSSNEELETTKEELQSLNEELTTVNAELQGKIDMLSDAHDDLQNLFNSTEVATIFLDNELRIKRFTSEAKRVSHLIAIDIGRPLSDIVSKLVDDRLLQDTQEVLRTLVVKEREVQVEDGGWFSLRILPYRTSRNTIEGLMLTFQDITAMKHAASSIESARSMASSIVETVREPLLVLDDHLRVLMANQSFYKTFQLAKPEVEQQLLYNLCGGAWNLPELRRALEEVLPKCSSFNDFIIDKTFPLVGRKVLALNARQLNQNLEPPGHILLAMEEVKGSEGKAAEKVEGDKAEG